MGAGGDFYAFKYNSCALLHSMFDFNTVLMNMHLSLIEGLKAFTCSSWVKMQKQPKVFVVQKVKVQLIFSTVTRWFKKFWSSCKNLAHHQCKVNLKPWILMPFSTLYRQIQWVAFKESLANLTSHCSVLFVTFTTSAKASRTVKFCLTLPIYIIISIIVVYND